MAGEMFGAPIGMSAAIGDLSQLATIDYNKALMAESQARMGETVMRTKQLQQTMQDDAGIRAIMRGETPTAPAPTPGGPGQQVQDKIPAAAGTTADTPGQGKMTTAFDKASGYIDNQMNVVNRLAGAGYFKAANDMFKGLSQEISHLSTANKNYVDTQGKVLKNAHDSASYANQLTLGIKDQASMDRAKMQFLADNPNVPLPGWMNLPYKEAAPYINQIRTSSKEGMEATKTESEILKNRATAAEQNALARLNKLKGDLEAMEVKAQAERQDRAAKAGEPTPSIKDKGKPGGQLSMAERLNADQLIGAANELYTGFDEILKLKPGTSMGTFADLAYSHDPSFIGGAKKWMANKITPDEMHKYAARLAGVNVAAAIIASGGRAPRVSQMEAEQAAVAELSGMSREVFYDKIHQATLKAIRGIERVRTGGDTELQNNLKLAKERLQGTLDQTEDALKVMQQAKTTRGGGRTTPGAAKAQPNITEAEYGKLQPGESYWFNGVRYTKGAQ
jgi:hypothetical protein